MTSTTRSFAGPASNGSNSCGIAVMAKASFPGRTKTRLVPPLTFAEAAAFNTAFLKDVAANILAAGQGGRIAGYMAFGPPGTEPFFREHLPSIIGLIPAWYPDFGDCLFAAIVGLFDRGHGSAVVLNADSPTLPTALLVETAQVLAQPGDRAVLGPSSDGGYYLLGLNAPHRRLFEDVAWSTATVASETLERAAEIGLPVHVLPTWYDVDDVASLRTLRSELLDGVSFVPGLDPHDARHSRRLVDALTHDADLVRRLDAATDLSTQRAAE